jgi:hypothetical protein
MFNPHLDIRMFLPISIEGMLALRFICGLVKIWPIENEEPAREFEISVLSQLLA